MRIIDADALKEAMNFNGGCGACFMYVDDADTIDAIPVEWLQGMKRRAAEGGYTELEGTLMLIMREWQKEQEART